MAIALSRYLQPEPAERISIPDAELDLTDQAITFDRRQEIGIGITFPIAEDGILLGRGYYQLTQMEKNPTPFFHIPVLVDAVLSYLLVNPDGTYVDCTVGGGSHSRAILQRLSDRGRLIALDVDEEALEVAEKNLAPWRERVRFVKGNFSALAEHLDGLGVDYVDGILMDLGVSSHQIDADHRGFSFQRPGPLDMRMDRRQKTGAYHVVNTYPEAELRRIFREYGEERHASRIARKIVEARKEREIDSTEALAQIVRSAVPGEYQVKSLARVFQAIRIEVNRELVHLRLGLEAAADRLKSGGRLVVISYHSLEDRIVKNFIREKEGRCICPPEFPQCVCNRIGILRNLTRKPIVPDEQEIHNNPRSRSAKLRAAERV